jgi:hypothetical protein
MIGKTAKAIIGRKLKKVRTDLDGKTIWGKTIKAF